MTDFAESAEKTVDYTFDEDENQTSNEDGNEEEESYHPSMTSEFPMSDVAEDGSGGLNENTNNRQRTMNEEEEEEEAKNADNRQTITEDEEEEDTEGTEDEANTEEKEEEEEGHEEEEDQEKEEEEEEDKEEETKTEEKVEINEREQEEEKEEIDRETEVKEEEKHRENLSNENSDNRQEEREEEEERQMEADAEEEKKEEEKEEAQPEKKENEEFKEEEQDDEINNSKQNMARYDELKERQEDLTEDNDSDFWDQEDRYGYLKAKKDTREGAQEDTEKSVVLGHENIHADGNTMQDDEGIEQILADDAKEAEERETDEEIQQEQEYEKDLIRTATYGKENQDENTDEEENEESATEVKRLKEEEKVSNAEEEEDEETHIANEFRNDDNDDDDDTSTDVSDEFDSGEGEGDDEDEEADVSKKDFSQAEVAASVAMTNIASPVFDSISEDEKEDTNVEKDSEAGDHKAIEGKSELEQDIAASNDERVLVERNGKFTFLELDDLTSQEKMLYGSGPGLDFTPKRPPGARAKGSKQLRLPKLIAGEKRATEEVERRRVRGGKNGGVENPKKNSASTLKEKDRHTDSDTTISKVKTANSVHPRANEKQKVAGNDYQVSKTKMANMKKSEQSPVSLKQLRLNPSRTTASKTPVAGICESMKSVTGICGSPESKSLPSDDGIHDSDEPGVTYISPYALPQETKVILANQLKEKTEREMKAQQAKQEMEEKKRKEGEAAFLAWMENKRKRGQPKSEQMQMGKKIVQETQREAAEMAFNEWMNIKRKQRMADLREKEEAREQYMQALENEVADKERAEKAFKRWIKKKKQLLEKKGSFQRHPVISGQKLMMLARKESAAKPTRCLGKPSSDALDGAPSFQSTSLQSASNYFRLLYSI